MAISTADFKNGMTLDLDGALMQISEFQHVKPGKGGAFVRTKLRNVRTGAVIERTFRAGEKMERANAATVKGNPVILLGNELKVGDKAPDFTVWDSDLKEVSLTKFKGKIKLIASVPSLDTPICDLEIKRFNDEAARLSKDLVIIFISMDLNF